MPRIAGVDIPADKPIRISLRYIYGVGPNGTLGRSSRAALARLTNRATVNRIGATARSCARRISCCTNPMTQESRPPVPPAWQTRAEQTDYQETAPYAETQPRKENVILYQRNTSFNCCCNFLCLAFAS